MLTVLPVSKSAVLSSEDLSSNPIASRKFEVSVVDPRTGRFDAARGDFSFVSR